MFTANDYAIEIPGLPALTVRAEIYPAEPDVGVFGRQVEVVDVRGAAYELTPEQDEAVDARLAEIETAVDRAYAEARDWS